MASFMYIKNRFHFLYSSLFWCHICNVSSLQIKSAFYSLLSGVLHSMPELANQKSEKICPVTLTKFAESDPLVCVSVWESALCTVSYIKVKDNTATIVYFCVSLCETTESNINIYEFG